MKTWGIGMIAVVAVGSATGLGLEVASERHDFGCAKSAAARDRDALVEKEQAELDQLNHPSKELVAGLKAAIQHYLDTVAADDKVREQC